MNRAVRPIINKHGVKAVMSSSSRLPDHQRIMPVSPLTLESKTTVRHVAEVLASHQWNHEAGTLHNDAWPLQMVFHSYDPVMAITDDTDNVW